MEGIVQQILSYIFNEKGQGMTAIMMLITIGSLWMMERREKEYKKERKELLDQFQKQSEEDKEDLLQIISKYQEGQISVVQAINEIRILLATIGAKL